MARMARRDAPGAVHHVLLRGIERGRIFLGDADREDFLARLDRNVFETRVNGDGVAFAFSPHLDDRFGFAPREKAKGNSVPIYMGLYHRLGDYERDG